MVSEEISYKSELVGVFGHPVAENPTIVMQEAAFRELGLNWRYLTIEVYPRDLGAAMIALKAFNMKGINLTIPHKVEVLKYLDEVAFDAQLMGAVNTVRVEDGKLIGENTDGKGFLLSLRDDAGMDPSGKHVVVIGSGGAARAIAVELALAGSKQITIVNRTADRGRALTDLINQKTNVKANFHHWTDAYALPEITDILVNATSIGLFPNVETRPNIHYETITNRMVVCDVIPNPPRTPFLAAAERRGANTLDGLGMLVYQGAIAFEMWTGQKAPVAVMHQALASVFDR